MTLSFGSGFPPIPTGGYISYGISKPMISQKPHFGEASQTGDPGDSFTNSKAEQSSKPPKTSALNLLVGGLLSAAVAPVNYMLNKMDRTATKNTVD
jgi:hypothetical protein